MLPVVYILILWPTLAECADVGSHLGLVTQVRNLVSLERSINATFPEQLGFLAGYYQHFRPELLGDGELEQACLACEVAIGQLIDLFALGHQLDDVQPAFEGICTLLGISTQSVCDGGILNYAPVFQYIVKTRAPRITAGEVCAAVLGKGCGAWELINDWSVDLPGGKPEVETPGPPPENAPVKKILHLTDIHVDLTYTVGNNAECDLPMCCGNTSGLAPTPESGAGYWGAYSCDTPPWTFRHVLEHVREEHGDELDYIMITGDYPAHDVWLQSRQHNLDTTKLVVEYIKDVFPDTQVFPSLGNHEPFPCSM